MSILLLKKAIKFKSQITFDYDWEFRECCPHALGMKNLKYHCLVYQFWWSSSKWNIILWKNSDRRCMEVDKMQNICLKDWERFSWIIKEGKLNSCIDWINILDILS